MRIALNSVRKQYQMLLSDGFPYLMITPGFILLVFVVIFPILFGFAIAFTNYNLYHTPPAKLVDWVGLKTLLIFSPSPSGAHFPDVLQWTVVWTLLATTLQCTVGVLLAILVNQKDLRFKPLIRTIFILPWAVPGFVTILVLPVCSTTPSGSSTTRSCPFWHQSGMAHRSVLDQNGADHDADRLASRLSLP